MTHTDAPALPDVEISGTLALDLIAALEYATHHTSDAETTARFELGRMRAALEASIRYSGYAGPVRGGLGSAGE